MYDFGTVRKCIAGVAFSRRDFLRACVLGSALAGLASPLAARVPAQVAAVGTRMRFVSPAGDDNTGDGSADLPWRSPNMAARNAQPGDVVYLRPGRYPPFEIVNSGRAGAPITFTTLPGEEGHAVIDGRLGQLEKSTRHGIYIRGKDHIEILNLTIEDCLDAGIWIIGLRSGPHGHHRIAGNHIRRTGGPGVFAMGYLPSEHLPVGTVWTTDILIEHNDVSYTNMILPHNPKGGVNECISVAAGIRNVVTRYNFIHDSRQYGIDYKHGFVGGGEIYGNRIWNIERYGIYLDTNRLEVHDVVVRDNYIWKCHVGIVMAREAASVNSGIPASQLQQSFRDIDIFNNAIWDMDVTGLFLGTHPNDSPYGDIKNIRVRFNTMYNCGVTGVGEEIRLTGWAGRDYRRAGIVDNFDVVGNVAYRPLVGRAFVTDSFGGSDGFTVEQNITRGDPLFVGPDIDITDLYGQTPDFRLRGGSPAIGSVDERFVRDGFEIDINGQERLAHKSAGAFGLG